MDGHTYDLEGVFHYIPDGHDAFVMAFKKRSNLAALLDKDFIVNGTTFRASDRSSQGNEDDGIVWGAPQWNAAAGWCVGSQIWVEIRNAVGLHAPPEPLTAEFQNLPTTHTGEAFAFQLTFSEEFPVTADTLRAAISLTGGSLTSVAQAVDGENQNWEITVTPSSTADAVNITLTPKESCEAEGAICTADERNIAETVEAEVPARPSTYILSVSITSNPGDDGVWDTGEVVTAQVVFSDTVLVNGPPGVGPKLAILLDGTRREAAHTGGSGTDTLTFSYTVTASDDGARVARVAANGLDLNGTVLGDNGGREADTGFPVAPSVTGVELVADDSADGSWTSGESIEVRVTFSEAVTVADGTPRIGVTIGGEGGTLDYASGSGSTTLVFARAVTDADGSLTEIGVTADSLALNGATIVAPASSMAAELGHDGTEPTEAPVAGQQQLSALTAEFLNWPGEHSQAEFTFKIRFSEEFPLSYTTLQDSALAVTNGTLTGVSRATSGENREWNVRVTPEGAADVTVTLAATTDCSATGAICNADRHPLSAAVTATVPATTPFRVRFENVPDGHDGTNAVTFKVKFSKKPTGYSYVTMRDSTLKIRQGGQSFTASHVRRLNAPHSDQWEVTIAPVSKADLTVSVGPAASCSATGAVCAADQEQLSNTASATIPGPPGLSVADARVEEAANVMVDFAVTLSRASTSTVTVDYATSDGTATAGSDYTASSGRLTFEAGDTTKTVSVAVIEDPINEGEETFTLTLSNASGGDAWLTDATATGTIENTDPMPRAWLARFGRTAATHVLDAVEERLQGGSGESWVRLGGHQIGGLSPDVMESAQRLAPQRNPGSSPGQALWDEAKSLDPTGQDMTLDQLLLGSAFHLVSNAEDNPFGPRLSTWGRVATSGFDGDEDRMTLTGTVTTATLGVDGVFTRWLTGVALAYSEGDGSFTQQTEAPSGDVTSTLTSVHPYVGYALSDRVKLWGVVGYGSGSLELVLAGQDPLRTDVDMTMGALGIRGTVLSTASGLELALRSDVLWVNTGSAATAGMIATEADTNRLRLVLEGSRPFSVGDGGLFTPTLELGLRRDGGDAEEGSGVEVGGRLRYASPSGLSIEASIRALVAHEASAYREWGASGALRYDPGQAGVGLTAWITPTWGMATSGVGRLWSQPDARGLAGGPGLTSSPAARVDAELGYGLRTMNGQGVLTPYARASLVEGEHAWHLGTRLALSESLNLSLEATHRQGQDDVLAQELALLATVPW